MLTSSLLSARTKWKIARDAFGTTSAPEEDESVAAFVRRKFGEQLLDRLVGPFVSGIYAGDPERLSLRAAFPQLYQAEKSAGSVIRGMMRAAKSRKAPRERPTLLSFRNGNETLVQALAAKVGSRLRLGAEVVGIGVHRDAGAVKFQVHVARREEVIVTERLVLATPADVAGTLLRDVNPAFEPVLGGMEYAPVAVVSLGFPGRAPAGHALLTSFVGGATDPGATALSPADLAELVHGEVAPVLQIHAAPVFSHVQVYRRALPQYNIGHNDRLMALERLRADLPGLFFVGNYLRGPAIGNCVELGIATAGALTKQRRSA